MKLYNTCHQWVEVVDGIATMGITRHAADEMGEFSYVELPTVGKQVKAGDNFSTVESIKAAAVVFAPITGTVSEVNQRLEEHPELTSEDPEGEGWICRLNQLDESILPKLMTKERYLKFYGLDK